MNKSVLVGVIVLVLIVGGAVGFKYLQDSGTIASLGGNSSTKPEVVSPQPLKVAAAAGYTLPTVNLDGETVPLLRIPIDTWGGYAALFLANGGSVPNKASLFYEKGKFAVELVTVESAQAQLDGYAAGNFPVIWSGMDSLPVLYNAFKTDKRVVPQVFGIFDWSFGADGIMVRGDIRTPKDLKGKTILTSGNTPYNFFVLWLLAQSNISPSEVKFLYLPDGPAAAAAFKSDRSIDAWVTWAPFITDVTTKGNDSYVADARLLISSRDANQLIADVYVSRLDFSREHPEILAGFSQAMMEAAARFAENPEPAYGQMASFFKLPGGAAEARAMVSNVHIANYTESKMFFDIDNPINAAKIFFMSQEYQKAVGSIPADASWEAETVIYTKALEAAGATGAYDNQPNRIQNSFNKSASFDIADLESQRVVLTDDVKIFFDAQRVDFDLSEDRQEMRDNKKYLARIAEQMNILGTTVVKLVGHLDTSKVEEFKQQGNQAFIEASAQAKLVSKKRAEYVKKVLIADYGCDPERLITEGKGWELPVDVSDPAVNRRVEVRFLSFE